MVLKKTVTVRLTLRLCRQRVLVVYGVWQMFWPMEAWTLNPDDCRNEDPMRAVPALSVEGTKPKPAAKPAPKAAKPRAKPSKGAAKPAAQVAAKPAAKPAAGEPIPLAPVERVQRFKVKYSRQKKWHTKPVAQ